MRYDKRTVGDIDVFSFYGDFVFAYQGDVRETIKKDIVDAPSGKILIDLTGVDKIDSSGLGTIVAIYRTALSRKAAFGVLVSNDNIKEVLHTIGLSKLFRVFESESEAVRSM